MKEFSDHQFGTSFWCHKQAVSRFKKAVHIHLIDWSGEQREYQPSRFRWGSGGFKLKRNRGLCFVLSKILGTSMVLDILHCSKMQEEKTSARTFVTPFFSFIHSVGMWNFPHFPSLNIFPQKQCSYLVVGKCQQEQCSNIGPWHLSRVWHCNDSTGKSIASKVISNDFNPTGNK